MKYLKACLKESQRLYPLVLGNSRVISEDMQLRGFHIPKKTTVFWSAEILQMDEQNFEEPEKYAKLK